MKKIIVAFLCMAGFGVNSQTVSSIQPLKANGYISWIKQPTSEYKVNVYEIHSSSTPLLVFSTNCTNNYYQFSSNQLTNPNLYYTISEYDSNGKLIKESNPAAIGTNPPPTALCYMDCNGLKESYRLSLMERANGTTFLKASDDAGTGDPSIGQFSPYYQAISSVSYAQLDPLHPYRFATSTTSGIVYARDHIQINANTPGGPYYDAQNNMVTNGWLIEKKMDKFIHFDGTNTGNYQSTTDWCEVNIGLGSSTFNAHMDPTTMPSVINPATSDQRWFVGPPIDSVIHGPDGDHDTTIYHIPTQLTCSTTYGGWNGTDIPSEYGAFMDLMIDCFGLPDSLMFGCITGIGDIEDGSGFGGTFQGLTFESVNAKVPFSATIGYTNGVAGVTETKGTFSPGLYRVNLFLKNGIVVPRYQVLGVKQASPLVVDINIKPNPIVNSVLDFEVTSDKNAQANLVVQKLDGTTISSETINLVAKTPLSRSISITGSVPYKQVLISVILPDGTIIQKTALTQ